jgi:glucose-1-phosphate thymidylyltransferase
VSDPERYGVVDFARTERCAPFIEKPEVPPSNYAVTGLYFLDGTAPRARPRGARRRPAASSRSPRFWKATSRDGSLDVQKMGRGYAWLDTGTHGSLLDAGNFVRTLTERQGMQSGSPEEIAFCAGLDHALRA